MQTFEEYYNKQMLEEGKLGKLAAIGALATSTAFGGFVKDWSKNYQTSQDPAKEERAAEVLQAGFNIPADAVKPIKTASYIFDGDGGHGAAEIKDYLEKTGAVESGYQTKIQIGGGPARSYWQVEPKTAIDLVNNSSAYFGPKFRKMFGDNALEYLKGLNEQQMSELLLKNDDLAATMAAAVWIRSSW